MATKRGYLTQAELIEYANITINDPVIADEEISLAEELIDRYVGAQEKSITMRLRGFLTAVNNNDTNVYYTDPPVNTLLLDGTTQWSMADNSHFSQLYFLNNMLSYCVVEMVTGVNKGIKRRISANHYTSRTIFLIEPFPSPCNVNDVYIVYQMQKFPRRELDEEFLQQVSYKYIPEAVKRAVAAQVQYKNERGYEFELGATDKRNESIEGYSYTNNPGIDRLIAPKARLYLRGIKNIKGEITV